MSVFDRVLARDAENDTRLGVFLDGIAQKRRLDAMSRMRGGNGFRIPSQEPRKDAQGLTRGMRKRKARALAMERVSEVRAPEFMHSAARMRAGYAYDWRSNSYKLMEAA